MRPEEASGGLNSSSVLACRSRLRGFLERSALKRAEEQLAGALEVGETVLDFDIGKNPSGGRIDFVVTNKAMYLLSSGGAALRVPYTSVIGTGGGRDWFGFQTNSGSQYEVHFGRSPRGAHDTALQYYKAVAQQRRRDLAADE